jgi:hypothetical protein
MTQSRKFTVKFIEAMEEGIIDPKLLAQNLMGYMSEREVESFARSEGYFDQEEEDDAGLPLTRMHPDDLIGLPFQVSDR